MVCVCRRAERKPFQLAKADPMANLALLFTKGLRLRMLTLAQVGTTCCNGVHGTMQSFQVPPPPPPYPRSVA
eukprot:SAG11_NODE_203_length_12529_cov_6.036444_14_plen_72_part_00